MPKSGKSLSKAASRSSEAYTRVFLLRVLLQPLLLLLRLRRRQRYLSL